MNAQITEDFGEPSFSSYDSEDQHQDEDASGGGSQGVHERSIPCITSEDYPWAVKTVRDIDSRPENRFN